MSADTSDAPARPTRMRREIEAIPEAVEALLARGTPAIEAAASALRERNPAFGVTIARGSSDHAAHYAKALTEIRAGRAVASLPPSLATLYGAPLRLERAFGLAVSQSGASPDLTATLRAAREGGALGIALTNEEGSPLAASADRVVPLHAGEERSVAATKTFVCSAVAGAWLVARWTGDDDLARAVGGLPPVLERAIAHGTHDWGPLCEALGTAPSALCLGRGPMLAMAGEGALKLKETARLHAEAYSAAEVLHGPVAMLREGMPVLVLTARDGAAGPVMEAAGTLRGWRAAVFAVRAPNDAAACPSGVAALPVARTAHPLLDPIAVIAAHYAATEALCALRGTDPDAPPHLAKVTRTL